MRSQESTPAFLVQKHDLGESDWILTFFTKNAGKVRGVARAAKKSRKRFGGGLDWFHLLKLNYHHNPDRPHDLFRLDSVEIVRSSDALARDLRCFAVGSYFLELVRELTQWHHDEVLLFDLLCAVIAKLDACAREKKTGADLDALTRFFEINLLDLLGFRPVLDCCVLCRNKIAGRDPKTLRLSAHRGGVICGECYQSAMGKAPFVSPKTVSVLQEALAYSRKEMPQHLPVKTKDSPVLSSLPQFNDFENQQARKVLGDFIQEHTRRPLQSLVFLDSL